MEDARPKSAPRHLFQGEPFTAVELHIDDSDDSVQGRELLDSWGVPYSVEYHPGVHSRLPTVRLTLGGISLTFQGRREISKMFLVSVETA
jgi:hypothetical protein